MDDSASSPPELDGGWRPRRSAGYKWNKLAGYGVDDSASAPQQHRHSVWVRGAGLGLTLLLVGVGAHRLLQSRWSRAQSLASAARGPQVLTGAAQQSRCSGVDEDCTHTKCCKDPSMTCYKKNDNWGLCYTNCTPGVHELLDPPKFQTAWTCEVATELCPEAYMPEDWLQRCRAGQLLYSRDLSFGALDPEVGNGHVATRVGSDTIHSAGLFNGGAKRRCGGHVSAWCGHGTHRAGIPAYHVSVRGLSTAPGRGRGHALDIERAVFLRRSVIAKPAVRVEERYYAPLQEPRLLVHEVTLQNHGYEEHTVELQAAHAPKSKELDLHLVAPELLRAVDGATDGVFAVEGRNKVPEVGDNHTSVALAANMPPKRLVVPADGEVTFYALQVVVTSLNSTDPTADAIATLERYTKGNFARARALLEGHSAAWGDRAENGRIEVEGDLGLAQAVNASLYYIRSSIREDWPYGVSPGGLASDAYSGHTFWDQETWMYPPMLMLEPDAARAMLRYRADRIEGARTKARGCRPIEHSVMENMSAWMVHGDIKKPFWTDDAEIVDAWCPPGYQERRPPEALLFPWESAATGTEAQFLAGKLGPWGLFEQHLNGDIALAARQYWYVTQDFDWLQRTGMPLANGTASFYSARLDPRPNASWPHAYDFNSVMGPDEYTLRARNNAYTNAVTRATLRFAAEAASELGHTGSVYRGFQQQADGLAMPVSATVPGRKDLHGGYHPEYEGFPERFRNGSIKSVVKQADAIMLNYPLGVDMDPQMLANDLEFYEGLTDRNGPAMTWSMFAINWLSAGDYVRSAEHFRRGYANAGPPFNVWTEYPRTFRIRGAVNFITGAGGFLQSLVFGTSGMRIKKHSLHFTPPPPSATGSQARRFVLHSLHFLGWRLRQEVTATGVRFELLGPDKARGAPRRRPRLCLHAVARNVTELRVGDPVTYKLPADTIVLRACEPEPVIVRRLGATPRTTVA